MSLENSLAKNRYFNHLVRYQAIYFSLLILTILASQFYSSFSAGKPLLLGGESYYHLSAPFFGERISLFSMLIYIVPTPLLFIIPALIFLGSIFLFIDIAKKTQVSEKNIFFIILLIILTPTFLFSMFSLSSYMLYSLLILIGFFLLLKDNRLKYAAAVPFAAATLFDSFSTVLLVMIVALYFIYSKKIKETYSLIMLLGLLLLLINSIFILKLPVISGPFYVQDAFSDLISDLGGYSGIGLFTILLAIISTIININNRKFWRSIPLLAIFIIAYLLNTNSVFFLSLFVIVLAADGLVNLFEQRWVLPSLKKMTLLLLLLGISFSSVAYIDRLSDASPTAIDKEMLDWMKINTHSDSVVISYPETSYYISYFAGRKAALPPDKDYRNNYNASQEIFSSSYIQDLFPLLERNEVSVIYVTEDMKHRLPKDRGFLFLLKNERFKLVHTSGEAEIWLFKRE